MSAGNDSVTLEDVLRLVQQLSSLDKVRPIFPNQHAVSDFLAGRRPLSYERVARLAAFFGVSPALFYPDAGWDLTP